MLGRIMVALVGIPLLIVILFFSPVIVLTVAFSALCAIAAYELLGATAGSTQPALWWSMLRSFLRWCPFGSYFGCRICGGCGRRVRPHAPALAARPSPAGRPCRWMEMAMTVFAALVVPSMLSVLVRSWRILEHARLYTDPALCLRLHQRRFCAVRRNALRQTQAGAPPQSPKRRWRAAWAASWGQRAVLCALWPVHQQGAGTRTGLLDAGSVRSAGQSGLVSWATCPSAISSGSTASRTTATCSGHMAGCWTALTA